MCATRSAPVSLPATDRARDAVVAKRGGFGLRAERDRVRRQLEELGITRSHTSDLPVYILGVLLTTAVGVGLVAAVSGALDGNEAVAVAAVVITVAGLLVGLLQWRNG